MRKLMFVGLVALVVGVTIGAYFSIKDSAEAAKPFVNVTHLEVHDNLIPDSCNLQVHLTWDGTKFAHKKGVVIVTLRESGNPVANTMVDIPKGTPAQNLLKLGGPVAAGTYSATATFWTTRGKDGASLGRIVTSVDSADTVCALD